MKKRDCQGPRTLRAADTTKQCRECGYYFTSKLVPRKGWCALNEKVVSENDACPSYAEDEGVAYFFIEEKIENIIANRPTWEEFKKWMEENS